MIDNCYIILELEFDPNPVEDIEVINKRIEEKRKEWSGKKNDFNKGKIYQQRLENISEISRIMNDESERRKEIKEACKILYDPIDKMLKIIGKQGEIKEDAIEKIAKKRKVSVEKIRKRAMDLGIKIVKGNDTHYSDVYEKYINRKPDNYNKFNQSVSLLGNFKAKNLYEFLYSERDSKGKQRLPCESLCQKARELKKRKFHKNDSDSSAGSKLCGLCESTFRDESTKKSYDLYLEYNRRKEILNEMKDIYAYSNELSKDQVKEYVSQLTELTRNRKLSENIILAFCKQEKILIPIDEKELEKMKNKTKVCRCGCINEISDGRKVCQKCGLDLFINCPKCNVESDVSVNICKCGFDFRNIDRAIALCEMAEEAIKSMSFQIAKVHIQDARNYWAECTKAVEVNARLSELEKRIGNAPEEMRKAIEEQKCHTANKQYNIIKKYFPDYRDQQVEEKINHAINTAEILMKKSEKAKDEQEIIDCCVKAYEACKDYPGILERISAYPPKKSDKLEVISDNKSKANILKWKESKSKGLVYYRIVRKIGAIPINAEDGDDIGRVSICTIIDKEIRPDEYYYYAVFTERGGVFSEPTVVKNPVLNLFEISNPIVFSGNESIQISWDEIPENSKVEIYKLTKSGREEKQQCSNNQGFLDKNLINDSEFRYRICLMYTINGEKKRTKGVYVSGIPTKLPDPIEKIKIEQLKEDVIRISWENPEENNIQHYFSNERPNFKFGEAVPLKVLEAKMQKLNLEKISSECGDFKLQSEEVIYIIPAVIKAKTAVIGNIIRTSKSETVSIKNVDIVNGQINIFVDAPKDATGFVVLYNFDQYPLDIEDSKPVRKYIPLKQYEHDNALIINSMENKNYYFSIYAEYKVDKEKDYSAGSEYLFINKPKEVISYSIKVVKKIFGKRFVLMDFESDKHVFDLPDIEIMSNVGAAPMFKKSSELFFSIEGRKVSGSLKVKIPIPRSIEKETYIKAFLENENMKKSYKFKLKVKSSYLIT